MLRVTLAGLWAYRLRLLMSVVAVVLGVGFVAGTLVLGASIRQSFFDNFAPDARNVDAAVVVSDTAPGTADGSRPTIPATVLTEVRAAPGVAAADGRVRGDAPVVGADGRLLGGNRGTVGVSIPTDPGLRGMTLVSGRYPAADGELVLDSTTAAADQLTVGAHLGVVDPAGRTEPFTLVGTVDPGVNRDLAQGAVAGFTTPVALHVTGADGFDRIDVRAQPGLSPAQLVERLAALPGMSAYHVVTGAQLATDEANAAVHVAGAVTDALLMFALVALFVAALVINNTFAILVAQRQRELALLRCVGASRRQVFGSTLAEAAGTGAVASALGLGVGYALAAGMAALLRDFGTAVGVTHLSLGPRTVVLSVVIGVSATVAAAVWPARNATRVPPVAAVGSLTEPAPSRTRPPYRRLAVVVVCGAVGGALTVAGSRAAEADRGLLFVAVGGCVAFLGVLAAGPLLVRPMVRLLGWLPGRLLGTPARLATANAARNPRRVAATTAALTLGTTLISLFTVVSASVKATAAENIAAHYPVDYEIDAGHTNRTLPSDMSARLRALPQFAEVAADWRGDATLGGTDVTVDALDGSGIGTVFTPTLRAGSLAALAPGTIALDSTAAARLGVGPGAVVPLTVAGTAHPVRVVAVMAAGRMIPTALLPVADFTRDFPPTGPTSIFLTIRHGVGAAASLAAVQAVTASDPLATVTTPASYKDNLDTAINRVMALFAGLMGLAILIAVIGIANTLSLSVIERTRESAVLRALGLTRTQLRAMLVIEAVEMAVLGAALGIGLGIAFGGAVTSAVINSSGGIGEVSVPVGYLAGYAVLAGVAGVLAALLPSRRAAGASVVAALAAT